MEALPARLDIGEDPGREYVLMFVPLNGTPYGGNPALGQWGSVQVRYSFHNLTGEAAFHAYGFRQSDGLWATNREEGFGTSAYYVTGNESFGTTRPATGSNPVPDTYTIRLSAKPHDSLPESFTFYFTQRPGSGLDSLHLTTDLAKRRGEVVRTSLPEGSFMVTHTGGNPLTSLVLLVAVSPGQPADFSLDLSSMFVRETT